MKDIFFGSVNGLMGHRMSDFGFKPGKRIKLKEDTKGVWKDKPWYVVGRLGRKAYIDNESLLILEKAKKQGIYYDAYFAGVLGRMGFLVAFVRRDANVCVDDVVENPRPDIFTEE